MLSNNFTNLSQDFIDAVLSRSPSQGYTHTFYRYPARFSPEFARAAIKFFSDKDDTILDPFMGGGTTLVEALVQGRNAIGTDINSLAHFVSTVKTTMLSAHDFDRIIDWYHDVLPKLNIRRVPNRHEAWANSGYQKHLPWRIRKILEFILSEIDSLPTSDQQALMRCVVLRAGQWALDCTTRIPSICEFRGKLFELILEYSASMEETKKAIQELPNGTIPATICLNLSAVKLEEGLWKNRDMKKPRLVITSPPYPNVSVLYHRWQVNGRRETPAPYWIADRQDGHGYSYYTMGSRTPTGVNNYFRNIEDTFTHIHQLLDINALVVQLISFSDLPNQLPRYLAAMQKAGYQEVDLPQSDTEDGRIWRQVPLRKWYASLKGKTPASRELLLMHRRV